MIRHHALVLSLLAIPAVACSDATDGDDRAADPVVVGDKADGSAGVELTGFVAPAAPVDGKVGGALPRIAYLFYADPGTKVDLEVTHGGSAAGLDTVMTVYGPRTSAGTYARTIATDDDGGYGKLSKISKRKLSDGGFYLVEVTTKAAQAEPAAFRLQLGCSSGSCDRTGPAAPIGADIRWTQNAAESRALALQAYQVATDRLDALDAAWELPAAWAVVMDIDETTLMNVTYQRERAELGTGYSSASWAAWVAREAAPPMPGAKAFTDHVRALGGTVVLVTNRKAEGECGPTEANLAAVDIQYDAILCKTTTSDKNPRFESIEAGTAPGLPALEIVQFVGDNIQDFPGLDQEIRHDGDDAFADFAHKFVLIPNPMYGSWESN